MTMITLKGREVPLLYTVYEMKLIQEEICPIEDFSYKILGKNKEDDKDQSFFGSPEHLEAVAKLVTILGNAGLEEAGEAPDLTAKKVLRSVKPLQFSGLVSACMNAMNLKGRRTSSWRKSTKKKSRPADIPDGGQLGPDRRASD